MALFYLILLIQIYLQISIIDFSQPTQVGQGSGVDGEQAIHGQV
jgi:hypothetical protein